MQKKTKIRVAVGAAAAATAGLIAVAVPADAQVMKQGPRVAQLEIYKDFGRNGQNLSVSGLWQSNLANVRWPDGSPVDNSISRIYNTGGVPFYMCFYADPNYRGFLFSLKPGERRERIEAATMTRSVRLSRAI